MMLGRFPDPAVPWQRVPEMFRLAHEETVAVLAVYRGMIDNLTVDSFAESFLRVALEAIGDALVASIAMNGPCEDVWLDVPTVTVDRDGGAIMVHVHVERIPNPVGPLAELGVSRTEETA